MGISGQLEIKKKISAWRAGDISKIDLTVDDRV